jgi:hypothetical protein
MIDPELEMNMKAFLCAMLLLPLIACCSHGNCITPPPMESTDQTNLAASIAAQLAGAPATGSLSVSYSTIVKDTYDKLADNDKALYLFLVAIECYLKEGQVGQDIAKQMAQSVQTKWASKQNINPAARVKTLDQRSPDVAPKIHSVLKKVGLE